MLAKKFRLKSREVKDALFKGDLKHSRLFVLRVYKIKEEPSVEEIEHEARPEYRFGLVISGKFEKKAVKRNLLRRRIFEMIRLNLPEKKDGNFQKTDLVLIPKHQIKEKNFQEIQQDIIFILNNFI